MLILGAASIRAQSQAATTDGAKKVNARPAEEGTSPRDPFVGASAEVMAKQCVTLDTDAGAISLEMFPEVAPETVRNFLNVAATGGFDTTTFSRVVRDFVIQGGDLSTGEHWGAELSQRMSHRLPDEPSAVKHVRGIVSMARTNEANSATTNFFILVGDGHHLDGTFSAFGRVTKGMEVVDAINHADLNGEKPAKPVHIKHAIVATCAR